MVRVSELLAENYALIVLLLGMYIVTLFDVFLEKRTLYLLRGTILSIAVLTVFDKAELYCSTFDYPTAWRVLFSALCYTLRPVVVLLLILVASRKRKIWMLIPAALNTLIAFSAFFTDIGYYFDEQNNFGRGPLGLTPYVVMFFYVLVLFLRSFRVFAMRNSEEALILLFLAITATVGSLLTAMSLEIDVNLAFAAEVELYYLYIYAQSTKRDALTGLFNRQSFYSDLRKHQSSLTGVVSIDMNELKWLNDTQGHEAGDRALKEISAVFLAASTGRDRVYRTGGDEFIMLCRSGSEKEIAALVDRMRSNVQAAGYSCAFGLSAGKQAGEMMQEADARMYADKARLKAEAAASGKALHMRD